MYLFLTFIFCPLIVKGKKYFKKGSNYIVCSNHNSLLDVPVTSPFIPGANRTIAKKEFMKVPVFNQIYKRGSVLVDRKSEISRKRSFDDMKEVLTRGLHMCIYPEGTRNKSIEPLQPFKIGAFRLAVESGKEIIPCLIFNTKKALPVKPSFCLIPAILKMHFLEPLSPVGETAESLSEKVFKRMQTYYLQNK
jgi:1-acyl-sn-glycerol-3-phosphate acyltransferase